MLINYWDVKVVEIKERYDGDCIPSNYTKNVVGYIQSNETNKTCVKKFTVSTNSSLPFLCSREFKQITSDNMCFFLLEYEYYFSGPKENEESCFYLLSA